MLNYLQTHSTDPCFNLAFEEYVLENKTRGDWLMLWQNANTVVVGLNQNTAGEINRDFIERHSVTVVRRATGGGAVYHDLGNLNYSFITDLAEGGKMELSRFTQPVCRALEALGVHAQVSGRNDITVDGRKISGVAQRVHRGRILHHGTLLFDSDPNMVSGALNVDKEKFRSKSVSSVKSRIGNIRSFLPPGKDMELAQFWQALLKELSTDGLGEQELTSRELEQINALANRKYRSWEWTYGESPAYTLRNKRRWPGGTVEVMLNVRGGIIISAAIRGDFMAQTGCEAAIGAITGLPCNRQSLAAALAPLDLAPMLGAITLEELLDTILK